MKIAFSFFLISLPVFAVCQERVIARGSSETWPAARGASIHVGNGRLLAVRDLGTTIRVTGKVLGTTTLKVGNEEIKVHVVSPSVQNAYLKLNEFLKLRKGLTLNIQGNGLSIGGELLRLSDWTSLAQLDLSESILFQAKLDTDLQIEALAYFRKVLRENQLPEPTFMLSPQARVRTSGDKGLINSYKRVFERFGFEIEESLSSLSLEPMVEVTIVAMELRKSEMQAFGVQWPASYEAQLLPSWQAASDLKVQLQGVEQRGGGRILASPTLLCRSGKEASFLAGGEFPIKIMSLKMQDVVWKQYGILLHVKPLADLNGRMSIELETEVSTIDGSQTVDGVPGLLKNKIQSHFDLVGPRTIALSGLIKDESSRDRVGLPVLSNLPILGPLFSSQDYKSRKTELIFFVTPRVLVDGPRDSEQEMKSGVRRDQL